MKKILLFCLLLVPFLKVEALYCSNNDLAYLKKLASNVSYSYDYVEEDGVIFSVTLTNLQDKFYVVDTTNSEVYRYTNSEITINNYYPGQKLKYEIYATDQDCSGVLYTILITLPIYNPYYNDPVCEGVTNYGLCQKWFSHGLNYDDFKASVEKYKNSSTIIEEPVIDEEIETVFEKLTKLLLEFYYIPLVLIIVGSSISIYVINKKDNIYN